KPAGLTFKERRELEELPARIEALEEEQKQRHDAMADPAYYRHSPDRIAQDHARLTALEEELATAYQRWEELEQKR
ncbi:MAG: ABC transporter ATP-binding protein, partial [Magnetococcales bacterium]|nr:ABC transporter ATP-binding protein [Magnetococcales bacterium]